MQPKGFFFYHMSYDFISIFLIFYCTSNVSCYTHIFCSCLLLLTLKRPLHKLCSPEEYYFSSLRNVFLRTKLLYDSALIVKIVVYRIYYVGKRVCAFSLKIPSKNFSFSIFFFFYIKVYQGLL